jgi:hypothetical protein
LARSGSALGCAVAEQGPEGAEAVQDRAFQTPLVKWAPSESIMWPEQTQASMKRGKPITANAGFPSYQ